APREASLDDRSALLVRDGHAAPSRRRDRVGTPSPAERRVAQSKSNLERPVGGFDVNPIAPAVVPNAAAPPIRINDVAPTVATANVVGRGRQVGLDGIAITDHNSVAGIREAEAAAGDLIVIPGIEISTRSGHVIAYGVREPILRDLSVRETVERITALGGVAV